MNVTDAAYATVHDYPGGSGSLAPRMGMSLAVLNSKVNPNTRTHHLTLAEAVKLVALTNDKRLAHAIAMECGGLFLDGAEDDGIVADMAVLESVTAVFSRAGALGSEVHASLADQRLTSREMKKIEAEAYQLRQKAVKLVRRLQAIAEQEPSRRG